MDLQELEMFCFRCQEHYQSRICDWPILSDRPSLPHSYRYSVSELCNLTVVSIRLDLYYTRMEHERREFSTRPVWELEMDSRAIYCVKKYVA